jgi:hypothetical protein
MADVDATLAVDGQIKRKLRAIRYSSSFKGRRVWDAAQMVQSPIPTLLHGVRRSHLVLEMNDAPARVRNERYTSDGSRRRGAHAAIWMARRVPIPHGAQGFKLNDVHFTTSRSTGENTTPKGLVVPPISPKCIARNACLVSSSPAPASASMPGRPRQLGARSTVPPRHFAAPFCQSEITGGIRTLAASPNFAACVRALFPDPRPARKALRRSLMIAG